MDKTHIVYTFLSRYLVKARNLFANTKAPNLQNPKIFEFNRRIYYLTDSSSWHGRSETVFAKNVLQTTITRASRLWQIVVLFVTTYPPTIRGRFFLGYLLLAVIPSKYVATLGPSRSRSVLYHDFMKKSRSLFLNLGGTRSGIFSPLSWYFSAPQPPPVILTKLSLPVNKTRSTIVLF